MTHQDILEQISELMIDVFDLENIVITPEMSAGDIEEWDSLSHIRFMITLERHFKLKFLNEEVAELKNIGDLVVVVQKKLA